MDLNEIEIEIGMMTILGILGEAHCLSFDAAARKWVRAREGRGTAVRAG